MKYSTFFDIMIIDYRGRLIMEYIIKVKNLEKKYGNFKAYQDIRHYLICLQLFRLHVALQ